MSTQAYRELYTLGVYITLDNINYSDVQAYIQQIYFVFLLTVLTVAMYCLSGRC